MQLLISDANILIDIEIGGLLAPMFSLESLSLTSAVRGIVALAG